MTGNDEDLSMEAIEKVRTLGRSLAAKAQSYGVSYEDITIGLGYAAFDLASDLAGSRRGGVEWLRGVLDVIEQQVRIETH
ncbi:MAG TPA: hypothetical protein VEC11_17575 [Allosphingosinicella sp.]|nr:hypothetical protein [Allosphingosinicella sp.]